MPYIIYFILCTLSIYKTEAINVRLFLRDAHARNNKRVLSKGILQLFLVRTNYTLLFLHEES
ncbi:uncharacterized protein NEPG_00641 [Nematocida parisii ERTm1]|uniref:Uncharacterized protein n=1 Tax=Nematocida parisii (strain ERTm3) TaxID=935791 RepID=I3ED68_NEMP3|nr:uncharacterized protein NEPG_00641 [Nematocida parisii ERTm1]EIJ87165.1 hypothetical protein NEQG_02656 [Nematocida parisii ERTm3]EIJ95116.1 hypothetical protein NEPG_00641 [Nematocida parisii ERTm1]|eukprot:XP_013058472.1 hypothetical protein NEPG_00641 [Nematocida parisii ERTm1]